MQQEAREGSPHMAESKKRQIDLPCLASNHHRTCIVLGLEILEDDLHLFKRPLEMSGWRAVADPQETIHPEVVSGHYQNALLPEQALNQGSGVYRKIVAHIRDGSRLGLNHAENRTLAFHP